MVLCGDGPLWRDNGATATKSNRRVDVDGHTEKGDNSREKTWFVEKEIGRGKQEIEDEAGWRMRAFKRSMRFRDELSS